MHYFTEHKAFQQSVKHLCKWKIKWISNKIPYFVQGKKQVLQKDEQKLNHSRQFGVPDSTFFPLHHIVQMVCCGGKRKVCNWFLSDLHWTLKNTGLAEGTRDRTSKLIILVRWGWNFNVSSEFISSNGLLVSWLVVDNNAAYLIFRFKVLPREPT